MNHIVRSGDVESFRELLGRTTGLRLDDDKQARLTEVLSARLLLSRSPSVEYYLESLAPRDEELSRIAEQLTVTETYFFRDQGQFRALRSILGDYQRNGRRSLKMISAACSSGEEPYSMAIAVLQEIPQAADWNIQLEALDLNPAMLQIAHSGEYRSWSMRDTPPAIVGEFFKQDGCRFLLDPKVQKLVQFRCDNLARPRRPLSAPESVDVIFCRNALMYLRPHVIATIVARFAEALRPGGYLFLGHAETLRGVSDEFDIRHEFGTFFYERRAELLRAPLPTPRVFDPAFREPSLLLEPPSPAPSSPRAAFDGQAWYDAVSRSTERIATLTQAHGFRERLYKEKLQENNSQKNDVARDVNRLTAARDLMQKERFHDALQLMPPASETGMTVEEDLLRAMLLVSIGRFNEAARLCETMLNANDLTAGAHYIWSLCEESLGNIEAATRRSRKAISLDHEFAMPHLQLGRLARRAHDYSAARVELQLALRLLHREDATRILLFGGGFNRSSLLQVCEMELAACERAS